MTDLKEVIPEFYSGSAAFLINIDEMEL